MTRSLLLLLALSACKHDSTDPSGSTVPDPTTTPDAFTDLNPDPHVFEANLRAVAADVTIDGQTVHALTYGGTLPAPEIRVTQGDRVTIHLTNDLPEGYPTTIHWHGIEGTNAADGTQVTQLPLDPGDTFTYDFVVPRPGVYWYHPHARGAQEIFGGMYGPLIVDDPDDATLVDMGVLPATRRTLVLGDITHFQGTVVSVEIDNAMEIMNGTEGELLLVNGEVDPTIEVPAGDGIRLQVVNTSITRFWRLSVPGHTLYRVGGEGGLLDRVRVEGGLVDGTIEDAMGVEIGTTQVDTGYPRGEIVLGPAERADLVLVLDGPVGDTVEMRWEDVARGRHTMWMEGDTMLMGDAEDDGLRPGRTIATFELVQGTGSGFAIAEGDPVLEAVGRSVEVIDTAGAIAWTDASALVLTEDMPMWQDAYGVWQMDSEFFIDGVSWHPHEMGPTQELAPTARTARIGDTIVWEIHNGTGMVHPFHPHGFSYQPLAFVRHDDEAGHEEGGTTGGTTGGTGTPPEPTFTRYPFGYAEFEDTTNIPAHTSLIAAVRIDDPNGDGGSVGRWLAHCHILQHGGNGMMTELVVEP